jgi:hypothetical protein
MSTDLPAEFASDPGLGAVLAALTGGPSPAELAGEQAALTMFRASHAQPLRARDSLLGAVPENLPGTQATKPLPSQPLPGAGHDGLPRSGGPGRTGWPGRPGRSGRPARPPIRRMRLGLAAAAAAVVAGSVSAAYAAVLPPPVQHFAHDLLWFAGVPNAQQPAQSRQSPSGSGSLHHSITTRPAPASPAASAPGTSPASRPSQKPSAKVSPSHSPSPTPSPSGSPAVAQLSIGAAASQIPAGGAASFDGQVEQSGQPVAGLTLTLLERIAGRRGWRPAGTASTSASGKVVVGASSLARNAAFRFTDASGDTSAIVTVTVVPAVSLELSTRAGGRWDVLVVTSPYAQPGNKVVLRVQAGGRWIAVRSARLGLGRRAVILIRARRLAGRSVLVVLRPTFKHAASESNIIAVPPA